MPTHNHWAIAKPPSPSQEAPKMLEDRLREFFGSGDVQVVVEAGLPHNRNDYIAG